MRHDNAMADLALRSFPDIQDRIATVHSCEGIKRIEDLPKLSELKHQTVNYAVDGLLVCGGVNLLTGKAGAGKSMFSMAAGVAVAGGKNFLGRKTKRMEILILDRENASSVLAERYSLLEVPERSFHTWGGWLSDEPPMPDSPIVLEFCRRVPALVIIDTLVRFNPGEESSATDMAAFMARCRKLAGTGAAVLCLHHTGKAATASDYRGSSDIAGGVDTAYRLEVTEGGKGLQSLRLHCFKFRVGEAPEPISLKFSDGEFIVTQDPSADQQRSEIERVRQCVEAQPGISTTKLVAALRELGQGRNEAERFIRAAVNAGVIDRREGERGSVTHWKPGGLELVL